MFGHVPTPISLLDDILLMNEIKIPKVRSRVTLAPKSKAIFSKALVLGSGANIHIFNNTNFFLSIITCLGKFVNITGSRTIFNKIGRLCGTLKSFFSLCLVLIVNQMVLRNHQLISAN